MFGFFKRKKQDQKQRDEELKRQQEEEALQQQETLQQEERQEQEATRAVEQQEDELLDMAEPEEARREEVRQDETPTAHPTRGGEPLVEHERESAEDTAAAADETLERTQSSATDDDAQRAATQPPVDDAAVAAELAHAEEPSAAPVEPEADEAEPEQESLARDEEIAVSPPMPGAASQIDDDTTPAQRHENERVAARKAEAPQTEPEPVAPPVQEVPAPAESADDKKSARKGWFARIREGLGKTRANLTGGLATLFLGKKEIDDELMEELETRLLMADVGIEATTEIIDNLAERVSRREVNDAQALYRALQQELTKMLSPVAKELKLPPKGQGPFVILTVGVNGVGKTTTIGKLTKRFQSQGRSVMLAAGDTFRAAAVEQLKVWGERNNVPVIAQHTGADSASVIYDAVSAAKARGVDILIADTAGRLHNKGHLMEELKKVQRVMAKLDATAPHEVMLVLDAGTGQNAINQAQTFNEAVPVTGITLTKLDGTAKGGIIFALAKQLATPIRYIGVGETLDDLRPFDADDFVQALFTQDDEQ